MVRAAISRLGSIQESLVEALAVLWDLIALNATLLVPDGTRFPVSTLPVAAIALEEL
jgi:hypothetical protein